MKVINKRTGKDLTSQFLRDSYIRDGYKWKVILGEGHKTFLKEEHWDMAARYADMGYKVIDINDY